MIDLKNRIIFIHIPKTGGSSVEQYFREFRNLGEHEMPALGIFINDKKSVLERQNGHNSLQAYERCYFGGPIPDDFRVFTVVRDPIKRFWSEYSSRRLPPPNRVPVSFLLSARTFQRLAEKPVPILKDLNSHLRPQNSYLRGLSENRVRILRQENLDRDFSRMCEEWGLPNNPLPRSNISRKRRRPANAEQIEQWLRNFYKEDFAYLGYK